MNDDMCRPPPIDTVHALTSFCYHNSIYKYSTSTLGQVPVDGYSGHKSSSMFYSKSCLSGDGEYLLTGSSCGSAYIWKVCGEASTLRLCLPTSLWLVVVFVAVPIQGTVHACLPCSGSSMYSAIIST